MPTFTNQATLTYNGNTVNSNTVTGNIVEVLSVTKTAVSDSYSLNNDVTYIVSIINSGTAPLTNVTVTDNLGAYAFGTEIRVPLEHVEGSVVYFQNGVLQASPNVSDTQPLTFTGITVPAGGNALLIYQAVVNNFAPLDAESTIVNRVTVTAPGITTPVIAEETISVVDEPVLSITKSLTPINVTENSQITYTFTIQNTGNTPAQATDDVVITDNFDPVLSDISVTVDGVTLPATSYTYNETTGVFSTAPGVITVPAATFTQDSDTGSWIITPGVTTVTVTGTI